MRWCDDKRRLEWQKDTPAESVPCLSGTPRGAPAAAREWYDRMAAEVRRSLAEGKTLDVEFRVFQAGSASRWVRLTGRAPRLRQGAPAGLVYGVVSDIEPRKRAEAAAASTVVDRLPWGDRDRDRPDHVTVLQRAVVEPPYATRLERGSLQEVDA